MRVRIAADVQGPTVSSEIFINKNDPPHISPRAHIRNQFNLPGLSGEMAIDLVI
jgi:hypothetical protein